MKKEVFPLVSVCIPTYNGETYLQEALDSVKNQTYKNFEVIISDDASTDSTIEIIDAFKKTATFPMLFMEHKPSSIAANWNNTLKYAKGSYIKFLFQDDVLEPTCIEKMVAILEKENSIGLVACKRMILTSIENRFTEGWIQNFKDLQVNLNFKSEGVNILKGKEILKAPYFKQKPINIIGEPTAIMFRKDVLDSIGYFNEAMFQLVDYEFCLRMFKTYKVAFIPEKLVEFRLHEQQASFINNKNEVHDKDLYYNLLYKDYFWYLHANFKWLLLKRFHWSFKVYRRIKGVLKLDK